jgi:hypothetical protein
VQNTTGTKNSLQTSNGSAKGREDVEREEDKRRNQQEDDAKGQSESAPWLKHYTKWMTRFKGRLPNILAISEKPPSASPNSRRARLAAGIHLGITI